MTPSTIYKTDEDCQLVQLVCGLPPELVLVDVLNSNPDDLYLYNLKKQSLNFYDISSIYEVVDARHFAQYKPVWTVTCMADFQPRSQQLFLDEPYFYYLHKGKLQQIDPRENKITTINLGVVVKEVLVLAGNSVYFTAANNDVYFVDLDWINDESGCSHKTLIREPIFSTQSVLNSGFIFDPVGNKVAAWVDPYKLKLFPLLNYNQLDCIGSHGIESSAIAWSVSTADESDYQSTVSALLPARDRIITWSVGSSKQLSSVYRGTKDFSDFRRHSEWDGSTLVFKPIPRKGLEGQNYALWRKVFVHSDRVEVQCEF